MSEPTTRSRTVLEVRISPAAAAPITRAAMCTARPPTSSSQLHLAGVQAGSDADADPGELVAERSRALDGPSGPVEGGQDPITGGLDQPAAELLDQPAGQLVMDVQQLPPAPVAQCSGPLGRADDIGEQHRRQHAGRFGDPADAGQELLDMVQGELRHLPDSGPSTPGSSIRLAPGEVLGQIASVLDGVSWRLRRCRTRVGAWSSGKMGRASTSNLARM
jgi:hypothetical protein